MEQFILIIKQNCCNDSISRFFFLLFQHSVNMSAAFYTRRRQCFTVAAEKFDTCGGGI